MSTVHSSIDELADEFFLCAIHSDFKNPEHAFDHLAPLLLQSHDWSTTAFAYFCRPFVFPSGRQVTDGSRWSAEFWMGLSHVDDEASWRRDVDAFMSFFLRPNEATDSFFAFSIRDRVKEIEVLGSNEQMQFGVYPQTIDLCYSIATKTRPPVPRNDVERKEQFLRAIEDARSESAAKEQIHRKRRVEAGLQETAGSGTPEPEVAFAEFGLSTFPEGVDIDNLEQVQQEMEAVNLNKLPMGGSRLGGVPDLPASIEWPAKDGKNLPFIAQIDLSDVPSAHWSEHDKSSWLYVFGVLDDEKNDVVVLNYTGDVSTLSRADRPDNEQVWADWCGNRSYSTVPLRVAEGSIESDWDNLAGWMFGEMLDFDSTPGGEADRVMKDGDDWINLLAVKSVGNMEWSDSGTLYLLIRRSDLERSDFGHVFGVMCSG